MHVLEMPRIQGSVSAYMRFKNPSSVLIEGRCSIEDRLNLTRAVGIRYETWGFSSGLRLQGLGSLI